MLRNAEKLVEQKKNIRTKVVTNYSVAQFCILCESDVTGRCRVGPFGDPPPSHVKKSNVGMPREDLHKALFRSLDTFPIICAYMKESSYSDN